MNFKEHVEVMKRTEVSVMHEFDPRLLHGIIGLTTEIGEIAEIIDNASGSLHKIDEEHLAEELGDLMWYMSLCVDAIGADYDVVAAFENGNRGSKEFLIKYFVRACIFVNKLVDIAKCKVYYSRGFTKDHIIDLLSYLLYEITGMAKYTKYSLDVIMDMNNAKLKARYPSKFTNYMANSRDLLQEKLAMAKVGASTEEEKTKK